MSATDTLVETQPAAIAGDSPRLNPTLAEPFGPFHTIARNMFGLDYRSLALLRITIAFCFLWATYNNAYEMRAFYTDQGVLPRSALVASGDFSLYFAGGGMPFVATLFAIQALLGFSLLIGYRTRLAAIGSYLFLFSMQNRQPVLLYGADISLRVGLFWMMFLPLARRFSMDSLTARTPPAPEKPYLAIPGIAFIAQVSMIYIGGVMLKTGDSWLVSHDAVAYALALDVYSRPLGQWIAQFPALTTALTIMTLKLEFFGPFLFIFPFFSNWTRVLGILLFAGLQIGFGLCMSMGFFGAVMISLTLVLLPAFFWDRLAAPAGRWLAKKLRPLTSRLRIHFLSDLWGNWVARERARHALQLPHSRGRAARFARIARALLFHAAVAALLVLMLLLNFDNVPNSTKHLSASVVAFTYSIGLGQQWDMFAPEPQDYDGWFVVEGHLLNGQSVDMMSGVRPASFDKPASVPDSYQSQIWMAYLISFFYDGASPSLFATYLGNQWNQSHTGDEQLQSIELNRMSQTVGVGPTKSEVYRETIWQQTFAP